MIVMNLQISVPEDKEEGLRIALRKAALAFIFTAAEGIDIEHKSVFVDGEIKLKEQA